MVGYVPATLHIKRRDTMREIWKDIPGYEGLYRVSNLGNVKSLNWRNTGEAKNLYLKPHRRGYLQVELAKNGIKKCFVVHRLVATAFLPNDDLLPQVNHKDENKKNNRADNLEWCTQSYNAIYSLNKHPERKPPRGGRRKGCRFKGTNSEKRVLQLNVDGTLIREWACSRDIFLQTGMSDWSISECCRGNRKTAYGYKWRYAADNNCARESA